VLAGLQERSDSKTPVTAVKTPEERRESNVNCTKEGGEKGKIWGNYSTSQKKRECPNYPFLKRTVGCGWPQNLTADKLKGG